MEPISPSRAELEEIWRKRLAEALLRYRAATETLRLIKLEYAHGFPSTDGHLAVHRAQLAEIWVLRELREYRRTLRALRNLQLHGKISPPDGEG